MQSDSIMEGVDVYKLAQINLLREMWASLDAQQKNELAFRFFSERLEAKAIKEWLEMSIRQDISREAEQYAQSRKAEYLSRFDQVFEEVSKSRLETDARNIFDRKLRAISEEFANLLKLKR